MSEQSAALTAVEFYHLKGLSIRAIVEKLNSFPTRVPAPAGPLWHIRAVQLALEQLRAEGRIPDDSPDPIRAATAGRRAAGEVVAGRGRHALPRRQLVATEEQWGAWDDAAKAAGFRTWSEWARATMDRAIRSES